MEHEKNYKLFLCCFRTGQGCKMTLLLFRNQVVLGGLGLTILSIVSFLQSLNRLTCEIYRLK